MQEKFFSQKKTDNVLPSSVDMRIKVHPKFLSYAKIKITPYIGQIAVSSTTHHKIGGILSYEK